MWQMKNDWCIFLFSIFLRPSFTLPAYSNLLKWWQKIIHSAGCLQKKERNCNKSKKISRNSIKIIDEEKYSWKGCEADVFKILKIRLWLNACENF